MLGYVEPKFRICEHAALATLTLMCSAGWSQSNHCRGNSAHQVCRRMIHLMQIDYAQWEILNCDFELHVSIERRCTIAGILFVCTDVEGILLFEVTQPSPRPDCLDGPSSWGFCERGQFLCSITFDPIPNATQILVNSERTSCVLEKVQFKCATSASGPGCLSDCLSTEASAGICVSRTETSLDISDSLVLSRLCKANRVCLNSVTNHCIPASDLIVDHECIAGVCLLHNVIYDTTWTAPVCHDRLCFGCFAMWIQIENRFRCTLVPTLYPAEKILISPVFPGNCSSLAHLQNGKEVIPLGIPALFDSPGSCEEVILSTAVIIFVDGWNPFHQVLQTFRLLFQALASFSGIFSQESSTGFADCMVLLTAKNTIEDVGPFGQNVLASFCTRGILELRNMHRPCFARLLLGSTPGGWDMNIAQNEAVPINFAGIHMAQWIKRASGLDALQEQSVKLTPVVTLILRRGRRAIFNQEQVINAVSCKSISQTCPYTLSTIDFDQQSFQDALALVARSTVLVGVHGAGLTNLIFLPPGAALVELRLSRARTEFRNLCRSFGKLHYEFAGTRMIVPHTARWSIFDDRDLILVVTKPGELAEYVSNATFAVRRRFPACC